jgi:ferredoxin/flavodoxin
MIFYFSATGNSLYTASRIAYATGDKIISIADCIKNDKFHFNTENFENIGIVCPTYAWGLPNIVCRFLENLTLSYKRIPYIYFISTYGVTPGQTPYFVQKYLNEKGLRVCCSAGVKMPDTWTPIFDLSNKKKVQQINMSAEKEINAVCTLIVEHKNGDFTKNKIPLPAAKLFYRFNYPILQRTSSFKVSDDCIGCGICAKNCPEKAILIQNGKPLWIKNECSMCLACLHKCPKFAISYTALTKNHGQYTHYSY